jgi:hypothetical protein
MVARERRAPRHEFILFRPRRDISLFPLFLFFEK